MPKIWITHSTLKHLCTALVWKFYTKPLFNFSVHQSSYKVQILIFAAQLQSFLLILRYIKATGSLHCKHFSKNQGNCLHSILLLSRVVTLINLLILRVVFMELIIAFEIWGFCLTWQRKTIANKYQGFFSSQCKTRFKCIVSQTHDSIFRSEGIFVKLQCNVTLCNLYDCIVNKCRLSNLTLGSSIICLWFANQAIAEEIAITVLPTAICNCFGRLWSLDWDFPEKCNLQNFFCLANYC